MTLDPISGQIAQPPRSFAQWLGVIFRAAAERLDPGSIKAPSIAEIKAQRLRDVEHALLDAEAEEERARHSVAMLRERQRRLQGHDTHHPAAAVAEVARR